MIYCNFAFVIHQQHCVKSVQIQESLNTGKCRPGKTPYLDSFHAVQATVLYIWRRALGIEKCSSTISENKRKNPEFQTS